MHTVPLESRLGKDRGKKAPPPPPLNPHLLKVMFAAARTVLRSCVTVVESILCSFTNYLLLLPLQLKVNRRNDM